MGGLFGGKSREERETEHQQKQQQQHSLARQYTDMVSRSLEQLTHWAFPDSRAEYDEGEAWQLWHTADDGQKYVDVTVTLQFDGDAPSYFECKTQENDESTDGLTREELNDALRWVICRS